MARVNLCLCRECPLVEDDLVESKGCSFPLIRINLPNARSRNFANRDKG
jgi:hypothetical protein